MVQGTASAGTSGSGPNGVRRVHVLAMVASRSRRHRRKLERLHETAVSQARDAPARMQRLAWDRTPIFAGFVLNVGRNRTSRRADRARKLFDGSASADGNDDG